MHTFGWFGLHDLGMTRAKDRYYSGTSLMVRGIQRIIKQKGYKKKILLEKHNTGVKKINPIQLTGRVVVELVGSLSFHTVQRRPVNV